MNIFWLDKNPLLAAHYHNDKHVVKMILELAQLLSTAKHELGLSNADKCYKSTHVNHPCAVWVRESFQNYLDTLKLFIELCVEYSVRYDRQHNTFKERFKWFLLSDEDIEKFPSKDSTPKPQCMPDDCKDDDDVVQAYRNYYIKHKQHLATWKHGEIPDWYELREPT